MDARKSREILTYGNIITVPVNTLHNRECDLFYYFIRLFGKAQNAGAPRTNDIDSGER